MKTLTPSFIREERKMVEKIIVFVDEDTLSTEELEETFQKEEPFNE